MGDLPREHFLEVSQTSFQMNLLALVEAGLELVQVKGFRDQRAKKLLAWSIDVSFLLKIRHVEHTGLGLRRARCFSLL